MAIFCVCDNLSRAVLLHGPGPIDVKVILQIFDPVLVCELYVSSHSEPVLVREKEKEKEKERERERERLVHIDKYKDNRTQLLFPSLPSTDYNVLTQDKNVPPYTNGHSQKMYPSHHSRPTKAYRTVSIEVPRRKVRARIACLGYSKGWGYVGGEWKEGK